MKFLTLVALLIPALEAESTGLIQVPVVMLNGEVAVETPPPISVMRPVVRHNIQKAPQIVRRHKADAAGVYINADPKLESFREGEIKSGDEDEI